MTIYKAYHYSTGDEWYFTKKPSNKKFKEILLTEYKLDEDEVADISYDYIDWEKIKVSVI